MSRNPVPLVPTSVVATFTSLLVTTLLVVLALSALLVLLSLTTARPSPPVPTTCIVASARLARFGLPRLLAASTQRATATSLLLVGVGAMSSVLTGLLLTALLVMLVLLVLAASLLLSALLVLGVSVTHVLMFVGVAVLAGPLRAGSARSVSASRLASATAFAVVHLLVLILSVTPAVSPTAPVSRAMIRPPLGFTTGFSLWLPDRF